jgi:hypothetical protein
MRERAEGLRDALDEVLRQLDTAPAPRGPLGIRSPIGRRRRSAALRDALGSLSPRAAVDALPALPRLSVDDLAALAGRETGPNWPKLFGFGALICLASGIALLWAGGTERARDMLRGAVGELPAGLRGAGSP